jgi:hypothetical protein
VHAPADSFPVAAPCQLCDDNIRAQREAYEGAQEYVDNRTIAADCRHGIFAAELPDDRDIRGIEQLLQDAGGRKRQRKKQDLVP